VRLTLIPERRGRH